MMTTSETKSFTKGQNVRVVLCSRISEDKVVDAVVTRVSARWFQVRLSHNGMTLTLDSSGHSRTGNAWVVKG